MPSYISIIVTIFVVLFAISYNVIKQWMVLSGYYRVPAQRYQGEKCRLIKGPEVCEDIKIHRTGHAFMTCGNEWERRNYWWPPMNVYNNYSFRPRDQPYVYNIDTDTLSPLALKNFADDEDFSTHGLGLYEDPNEPNEIYLFVINHKRSGSVVELFKHTLNTFELYHVKTFKHNLIYSPNGIAPVSKDEFYVTNDLYYRTRWKHMFEVLTFRPWGNVVFHSSKVNNTEIVVHGLRYGNGINVNWDYSRVFVGAIGSGELIIYERRPDNKLRSLDTIKVEHSIDNISVDQVTGEIYLAVLDNALSTFMYMKDTTGNAKKPGVGVIKVRNNTAEDKFLGIKYSKEKIFEDDGSLFYCLSVAAPDSSRNVMLLGSFLANGFVRCKLY